MEPQQESIRALRKKKNITFGLGRASKTNYDFPALLMKYTLNLCL